MKKTIGILVAIAAVGIGGIGFTSYVNNEVDRISSDVINTTDVCNFYDVMDEADDLYNKYNALLSEDTKSKYNKAREKERLYEVNDQAEDIELEMGDYINILCHNMDAYNYSDAYENIKLILSKSSELNGLIDEHNDILYRYPEFGEGLFEHGTWLAGAEDIFDLGYVWDSYSQIIFDTWYWENCFSSRYVGDDDLCDPEISSSWNGFISISQSYDLTECFVVDDCMNEQYKIYYGIDAHNIIDQLRSYEDDLYSSLINSIMNTEVFDIILDNYYNIVSKNLAEDTDDVYRNTLKISGNPFNYQAHLNVTMDSNGKYNLDKEIYRTAVIDDIEHSFRNDMKSYDPNVGLGFGRISLKKNGGFRTWHSNPVEISDSCICNYSGNFKSYVEYIVS